MLTYGFGVRSAPTFGERRFVDSFVLYGLDKGGRLVSSERFSAPVLTDALRLAEQRLTRFERVELWDGSVCVLRKDRPSGVI